MIQRFAITLALLCPFSALPQDTKPTLKGIRFGRSVIALGDLNEDGVEDFAVGAPYANSPEAHGRKHIRKRGLVLVFSGSDRRVLQEWQGEALGWGFGHSMQPAGDSNGDGIDDVLVGYERGSRTEVRSGLDGQRLLSFDRHFSQVHHFGDADQDGLADYLLVCDTSLEVRSGQSRKLLAGPIPICGDGDKHPVGDLDGDGLTDLFAECNEGVFYFSGMKSEKELEELRLFDPELRRAAKDLWPETMATMDFAFHSARAADDLDGDGSRDVIMTFEDSQDSKFLGLSFDRNRPLFELFEWKRAGHALAFPGDLNGDGANDVILADGASLFLNNVSAHSGRDGKQLWHISWDDGGARSGVSFALLPAQGEETTATLLIGSAELWWHGPDTRNGSIRGVDIRTGELRWQVDVDQVSPLKGGVAGQAPVYR